MGGGWGGCIARLFFFSLFSLVQQTNSGIQGRHGNRVKPSGVVDTVIDYTLTVSLLAES